MVPATLLQGMNAVAGSKALGLATPVPTLRRWGLRTDVSLEVSRWNKQKCHQRADLCLAQTRVGLGVSLEDTPGPTVARASSPGYA